MSEIHILGQPVPSGGSISVCATLDEGQDSMEILLTWTDDQGVKTEQVILIERSGPGDYHCYGIVITPPEGTEFGLAHDTEGKAEDRGITFTN